ncbi:MAG: TIGR00300 family protein [Chloroflexi bacterium]|nr:TIGR00300 family protein [Chloroflexota bacterium]
MPSETVELRGHIIDSLTLPKVLDQILAAGGQFEIEEVQIGKRRTDLSYARIKVQAASEAHLDRILGLLKAQGAQPLVHEDVVLVPADMDSAFPDDFYSTTNLQSFVRWRDRWLEVADIEMDCGIVVDEERGVALCTPMHRVRKGDAVVVGHLGVRVVPLERQERGELFAFMGSEVSPERPKGAVIQVVARELEEARAAGKKALFVGGPVVVHSGGVEPLVELIRRGYFRLLFAGNGFAAHDIENALYGTSLGVRLSDSVQVSGGHRHHLRAINTIRRLGGIRAAVEAGVLTSGVMRACVTHDVPFILAGSVRDDGPLPEVVSDVLEAADAMRREVRDVHLALVVGSALHAIATGNLLPATTRLVVVDINPAVLTKISDRGSFQTVGIVSDAGLFLRELLAALGGGR